MADTTPSGAHGSGHPTRHVPLSKVTPPASVAGRRAHGKPGRHHVAHAQANLLSGDGAATQQPGHLGSPSPQGGHFAEPPERPKGRARRVAAIVGGAVAGVLALAYVFGAVFFMNVFLPGTTLRGHDVSLMSAGKARSVFDETAEGYVATVTGDGIELEIDTEAIGLEFDTEALVSQALEAQNPWLWPVEVLGERDLEIEERATFDEAAVDAMLAPQVEAANEGATPTTDASVSYDGESHAFVVSDEAYGTQVDPELASQAVREGLSDLDREIVLDESALVQPTVTSDDPRLARAAEQANALTDCEFPLMVGDAEVMRLNRDTFKDWVAFDEDWNASVSAEKVDAWVNDVLAPQVNTVGSTRTYTRPDGKQCTVTGGTYGWSVDVAGTSEALRQALEAKSGDAVTLTASSQAAVLGGVGGQDWGSTYVDIDISEQYVRYFVDGSVAWEAPCVTGNPNLGNATPEGVYTLNGKSRNQTLVGLDEDKDGEPDYETPVSYWMPFIGNAIGLHDASWRWSFGSNVYTYDGSHGCVNLPIDSAAALYDMIGTGTVVVVHY